MLDKQTIIDTVEALSRLDTLASCLPNLTEQLDTVLDRIELLAGKAQSALALLSDLRDAANLAAADAEHLN